MNPISSSLPIAQVEPIAPFRAGQPGSEQFGSVLQSAMQRVELAGANASQSMEKFMKGDDVDLHNVAMATQKAALDFEMFLQVRNKVVQAYQEIMRLQI
ncbi:MAG: flagellar hook-basal body complex protein FliE [Bryobacteraceae bacterium]|nr:flagellar hook-basal body complex protein FliE [Bryobacteraceae bacterium]